MLLPTITIQDSNNLTSIATDAEGGRHKIQYQEDKIMHRLKKMLVKRAA